MSVSLIKADTFHKVEEAIFAAIKSRRDNNSQTVLIVPDQFTQSVEKSLFKALNIKCSFDIDVMSFARLAKHHKHSLNPELNQQTSVLLLSKIISQNIDKLTCYNKVAGRGKFANQMYAVMTAVRNNNISPVKLREVAAKLEGFQRNKINDIALVLECYIKELESYTDISSLLDDFREDIPNIAAIKGTDYYVFGFHSMTPNKRAIVKKLMQNAKSVTLGIVDISAHENARISPSDIKALESLANGFNATVENYLSNQLTKEQAFCLDKLFGYNITRFSEDNSIYNLLKTRNIEDEIKAIAQKIKSLIMQGYRYRDIAVVCEDFSVYSYLLNKTFDNYGIHYFIDDKISIAQMPQYKFFAAAVKFLKCNGDRLYALELLKSGACDVDFNHVNKFENYIYKYNIDRSRLFKPFNLGEETERILAENVRQKFINYINLLHSAYKKGDSSQMFDAVLHTFEMLKNTPQSNYVLQSDIVKKDAVSVAWTRLSDTLEDISLMLTSSSLSGAEVLESILDCLSSIEFSLAPIKVDCVFIGTPQDSRFESVKVMFLMGANSMSYPIVPSDSGIIRDSDIEILNQHGLNIEPNHLERVKQSKFYITQLLVMAKEQVFITCPSLYDDMATIAAQLKAMFNLPIKEINPNVAYGDNDDEIALKIGTYSNLQSIFCRNYGKGEVGLESISNYAYSHCDSNLIKGLYESVYPNYYAESHRVCFKDNFLKISGLERFFECPFVYFADNALKIKDRPMGKVEINELGTFVHRVLELFYTYNREPIHDQSDLQLSVKATVESVLREEEFAHFARQDASHGYEKQLEKRCLAIIDATNKMLMRSQYRPEHLEYRFGMGGEISPIEIDVDGKKFKVRGVIDRIDSCGDSFIVIDYKSSDKQFDVGTVFTGHRLQLIIYLQAVLSDGKTCAGLYYLGLPYKYARDSQDEDISFNYKGFVVKDLNEILLQDSQAEDNSFLPIKYKRGNKDIDFSKENLLTENGFKHLRGYALKLVEKAVKTIGEGYITPVHTANACRDCKYNQLCKVKDKTALQLKEIKTVWGQANESEVE